MNGDFDYNGRVDSDDYFLIDQNFSNGAAALALPLRTASAAFDSAFSTSPITTETPLTYDQLMSPPTA
jgi:hypothetical protein